MDLQFLKKHIEERDGFIRLKIKYKTEGKVKIYVNNQPISLLLKRDDFLWLCIGEITKMEYPDEYYVTVRTPRKRLTITEVVMKYYNKEERKELMKELLKTNKGMELFMRYLVRHQRNGGETISNSLTEPRTTNRTARKLEDNGK